MQIIPFLTFALPAAFFLVDGIGAFRQGRKMAVSQLVVGVAFFVVAYLSAQPIGC